jgi:hypothetical protein
MAAHAEHETTPESSGGAALLPIFAIATVLATVAICFVVAAPSVIALILALTTVIGFAGGIAVLLGRLIGPDEH